MLSTGVRLLIAVNDPGFDIDHGSGQAQSAPRLQPGERTRETQLAARSLTAQRRTWAATLQAKLNSKMLARECC